MRLMQVRDGRVRRVVATDRGRSWIVGGRYPHGPRSGQGGDRQADHHRQAGEGDWAAAARPIRRPIWRRAASCRRSIIPIRRICWSPAPASAISARPPPAIPCMPRRPRRRGVADRFHEDVPHGPGGRQAGQGRDRRAAGMVLQGRRQLRRGAGQAADLAGLCRGWRRGAGDRRHLPGRPRRAAVADRLRAPQRVLRPRHGAAELPVISPIPSCGRAPSGRSFCSATCRTTCAAFRASAAATR